MASISSSWSRQSPGEYKVQARLENAELNLLPFRVEAASLNQAANAPAPAPAAAMGATARTDGTGADATGFEGGVVQRGGSCTRARH